MTKKEAKAEAQMLEDKKLLQVFKRCIGGDAVSCTACAYKIQRTGQCQINKLYKDVCSSFSRLIKENEKLRAREMENKQ